MSAITTDRRIAAIYLILNSSMIAVSATISPWGLSSVPPFTYSASWSNTTGKHAKHSW